MNDEIHVITEKEFIELVLGLKSDNYFDLSSFEKKIGSYGICKQTINNIIDCLVFDFSITCDANFVSCKKEIIIDILKMVNELKIIDSKINNLNKEIR